jgi:chemotaxis protein CheD
MNHYVLPIGHGESRNARYGDVAIDDLIVGMKALGCRDGDLVAKVFGGAAVLPVYSSNRTVGMQNLQLALKRLNDHGIPVIGRRTGGAQGLLIRFATDLGEVTVRKVDASVPIGPGRRP